MLYNSNCNKKITRTGTFFSAGSCKHGCGGSGAVSLPEVGGREGGRLQARAGGDVRDG